MTVKKQSKGRKVALVLSSSIVKKIDEELRRLKKEFPQSKPSRASICAPFIEDAVLRLSATEEEKSAACKSFLEQSKELKKKAMAHIDMGEEREASSAYLLAAAKELEALAILGTDNESMIRSTLIQTIQLIKCGTGYNHLPSVPTRNHVSKYS